MSIHMSTIGTAFFVQNDNKQKALDALKKAGETDGICGLTAEDIQDTAELEQLLRLAEWEPEVDDHGNIVDLWFQGDRACEDLRLMDALAPHVKPGSFIRMCGEDGTAWEWRFTGGRCEEVILDPEASWNPDGDRQAVLRYLTGMEEAERRKLGLLLIEVLPPETLRKAVTATLGLPQGS